MKETKVQGNCKWSAKEQCFNLILQEAIQGMELLPEDQQPPILVQKLTEEDLASLCETLNKDRKIKMGDKAQIVLYLSVIGAYEMTAHLRNVLKSYRHYKAMGHPALKNPDIWEVKKITPEHRKLLEGGEGQPQ